MSAVPASEESVPSSAASIPFSSLDELRPPSVADGVKDLVDTCCATRSVDISTPSMVGDLDLVMM